VVTKGKFKMPETPRWGIRTWRKRGAHTYVVCWHAIDPKPSQYLIAHGLTRDSAQALARALRRGQLG